MPMMVMSEYCWDGTRWKKSYKADQADMGPERQSGRKAQTANIVAAKVTFTLPTRSLWTVTDMLDCGRCHQDVFGTKSHVEDDPRPHGWYPVSTDFCDTSLFHPADKPED